MVLSCWLGWRQKLRRPYLVSFAILFVSADDESCRLLPKAFDCSQLWKDNSVGFDHWIRFSCLFASLWSPRIGCLGSTFPVWIHSHAGRDSKPRLIFRKRDLREFWSWIRPSVEICFFSFQDCFLWNSFIMTSHIKISEILTATLFLLASWLIYGKEIATL